MSIPPALLAIALPRGRGSPPPSAPTSAGPVGGCFLLIRKQRDKGSKQRRPRELHKTRCYCAVGALPPTTQNKAFCAIHAIICSSLRSPRPRPCPRWWGSLLGRRFPPLSRVRVGRFPLGWGVALPSPLRCYSHH